MIPLVVSSAVRIAGRFRRLLLWLFLSAAGGVGLPPRGGEPLYERRQAPDRAAGPAAGPRHRPGRRAAQLHAELRASSVYPKMNAYILKWIVDIGDKVKKGDVLATLFVPELVADHGTKKATVVLDQERVALAKEVVEVAKADVEAARHGSRRPGRNSPATRPRPSAGNRRPSGSRTSSRGAWSIPRMSSRPPIGGRRRVAMRDTAAATVLKAEAELLSRRAALSKAKVDVRVAEAALKVAESEEKRSPGLGRLPRAARPV